MRLLTAGWCDSCKKRSAYSSVSDSDGDLQDVLPRMLGASYPRACTNRLALLIVSRTNVQQRRALFSAKAPVKKKPALR